MKSLPGAADPVFADLCGTKKSRSETFRALTCFLLWSQLGSNQRPLACEASALPLSYETVRVPCGGCPGPVFVPVRTRKNINTHPRRHTKSRAQRRKTDLLPGRHTGQGGMSGVPTSKPPLQRAARHRDSRARSSRPRQQQLWRQSRGGELPLRRLRVCRRRPRRNPRLRPRGRENPQAPTTPADSRRAQPHPHTSRTTPL